MQTPDKVEQTLAKAARQTDDLTADERKVLREVLEWWRTWKAWGKLGKIVLWTIIAVGSVAAALREVRGSGWFGG